MRLKVGLLDANRTFDPTLAGLPCSGIAFWLKWEFEQAGVPIVEPEEADICLLLFSGAMHFGKGVRAHLRKKRIALDPEKRARRPYIITGGAVDCTPAQAFRHVDALVVGEAYAFVRGMLGGIKSGWDLEEVRGWIKVYPHAIEREQFTAIPRDPSRPWQFIDVPPKLARPDDFVDWRNHPIIRTERSVSNILASKGCAGKCLFCSTSFRQNYLVNPHEDYIIAALKGLKARGQRLSLMTNDAGRLPYFRKILTGLDSQSFSVRDARDPGIRARLVTSKLKLARFGIEGLSERLRTAVGKPVSNDDLEMILMDVVGRHHVAVTLFYIAGLPFEDEPDAEDFRSFYYRVNRQLDEGIARLKFTAYAATPPAPLARFAPNAGFSARYKALSTWTQRNNAGGHLMQVWPALPKSVTAELASNFDLPLPMAEEIMSQSSNFDFAPTPEDAERQIAECIEWPIGPAKRWKMTEIYRRKMGVLEPAVAP